MEPKSCFCISLSTVIPGVLKFWDSLVRMYYKNQRLFMWTHFLIFAHSKVKSLTPYSFFVWNNRVNCCEGSLPALMLIILRCLNNETNTCYELLDTVGSDAGSVTDRNDFSKSIHFQKLYLLTNLWLNVGFTLQVISLYHDHRLF
jgi:hypothetical protein